MGARRLGLAAVLVLLAGCPAKTVTADGGDDAGVPEPTGCEATASTGTDCRPLFATSCPDGTRAALGTLACVPVGVAGCDGGLVPDDAGFGCEAPVPDGCGAFERATPAGCVPLGDCGAPFPPAAATLFVDDDGIEDATHFRTLGAAVLAAPDGGVVAVEAGTYAEQLVLTRPVRVVARCPAQVHLVPPPDAGSAALAVMAPVDVELSGFDVDGHVRGVLADGASRVTVRDLRVAHSTGLGFHARAGSTLTLERVAIADVTPTPQGAYGWAGAIYGGATVVARGLSAERTVSYGVLASDAPSRFDGDEVVLRHTRAGSDGDASMLVAQKGAVVLARRVVLDDSDRHGARASSGSRLELDGALVKGTHGDAGAGLASLTGSIVVGTNLTLVGHPRHGVFASGTGTRLTLRQSEVRRSGDEGGGAVAIVDGAQANLEGVAVREVSSAGIFSQQGAVTLTGVLVRGVVARPSSPSIDAMRFGSGIDAVGGGEIAVNGLTVEDATTMGVSAIHDGVLRGSDVLVRRVANPRPVADWGYGVGIWASHGGVVTLERVAAVGVAGLGSIASGLGTRLTLRSFSVADSREDADGAYGHALVVSGGGTAQFEEPLIVDSHGVGLVAVAGTVRVTGGTFARNTVALHAQDGSTLEDSDDPSGLTTGEVRVSSSTRFFGNGARVGTGVVPVPVDPLP